MSQAMLRAVAELTPQDIGDDIYGEDATVNELQRRAAELTGKEAVRVAVPGIFQSRYSSVLLSFIPIPLHGDLQALLVSTGTQGNLAAILALCGRGDELLLGSESHVLHYEVWSRAAAQKLQWQIAPV